jgi:hypothetical protein
MLKLTEWLFGGLRPSGKLTETQVDSELLLQLQQIIHDNNKLSVIELNSEISKLNYWNVHATIAEEQRIATFQEFYAWALSEGTKLYGFFNTAD